MDSLPAADLSVLVNACNIIPKNDSDEAKVIDLSHYISNEVIKRAGVNLDSLDKQGMFYGILLCLIAVSQLTRSTNLNYEMISIEACLTYFMSHEVGLRNQKEFGELFEYVVNLNNYVSGNYELDNENHKAIFELLKEPLQELNRGIYTFFISKANQYDSDMLLEGMGNIIKVCMKNI